MATPLALRRVRHAVAAAWTAVSDVLSGRMIRRWNYSRYAIPVAAVTPEAIKNALGAASQIGDLTFIADIHDLMPATDAHIRGIRAQLRAGVAGIKMTVVAVDDSPEAAKIADLVRQAEERPGINQRTLVDGIIEGGLRGASLTEVIWEPPAVGAVRYWAGFSPVPEQRLRYDLTTGDLHLVESARSMSRGVPLCEFPEGKFVRAQVDQDVPDFSMRGAYRSILSEWYGRLNVSRWEQVAIERYGMPIPVGKASGEAAREAMAAAMKDFGAAGMLIIDPDSSVELAGTSVSTSGNLIHETYLEKSAERISVAILGATQTATIAKDAGSKQSADTHQGIRRDILFGLLDLIGEAKRRDLWTPFVRMNFGEQYVALTPRCVSEFDEPIDLLTTVNAWDVLVNRVGLPIARSYAYQVTGIEEPETGEELLAGLAINPATSPVPGVPGTPALGPASAPGTDVQALALNGAQVAALQAIVAGVADGTIPPASAVEMIRVAFPAISPETALAIVAPVAPGSAKPEPKNVLPFPPKAETITAEAMPTPDSLSPGDGEEPPPVPEGFGMDLADELLRIAHRPKSSGALKELGPRLKNATPDLTKTTDSLAAGMLEATMRTLAAARKTKEETSK